MQFLHMEVKGAERLSFVCAGLDNPKIKKKANVNKKQSPDFEGTCPTAAGLLASQGSNCLFCEKTHESKECIKAQSMTIEQRREKAQKARACFRCLKTGHTANRCKTPVRCMFCTKRHLTLMCPGLTQSSTAKGETNLDHDHGKTIKNEEVKSTSSQLNHTNDFLIQTLLVDLRCGNKHKRVRALYDSGSQRSYILKATTEELGLQASSRTQLRHMLFGGSSEFRHHGVYEVDVSAIGSDAFIKLEVLDHLQICGPVPRMSKGPWVHELNQHGIFVSDLRDDSLDIELLIGADYFAKLLTGRRCELSNGLTALETQLGWTLSGKVYRVPTKRESSLAMTTITLHVQNLDIKSLWDLESIGIKDPAEALSKEERESRLKQDFFKTIERHSDGRYTVSLPWINGPPKIPDNRNIAEKRLFSVSRKLYDSGIMDKYDAVLSSWSEAQYIENASSTTGGHYLPHRAVVKLSSSTTPIRPVFDASCKAARTPSLNDCLEKGVNLLELLPNILLRFREKPVGITADIKKAFQMIEVVERDRDFLKFLWWENYETKTLTSFRHKRVVFGLTCSPFILGAVIEYHLTHVPEEDHDTAARMLRSFYVDNCITSVDTFDEFVQFKHAATRIMSTAHMELCQWESTAQLVENPELQQCFDNLDNQTSVLGLMWDKVQDILFCVVPEAVEATTTTKRAILSFVSKVFDPIGLLCPAMLPLKLILQQSWASQIGWDEELPDQGKSYFADWQRDIQCLTAVKVPRNVTGGSKTHQSVQLHVFSDASQEAYAAVVYLRIQRSTDVFVQLLLAKSRVAPIKRPSIPRLELLGCVIAARLARQVQTALTLSDISTCYWSDSATALAWIKRNDNWGTFVGNRVKEILSLTNADDWRHVPGPLNPADLPSRGCTPRQLMTSKWWEGPPWLKKSRAEWPSVIYEDAGEDVEQERRRTSAKTESMAAVTSDHWYTKPFTSFHRNVRVVAWIMRFVNNLKKKAPKQIGTLTLQEVTNAENLMFRFVQEETLSNASNDLTCMRIVKDQEGLWRVCTKLFHEDNDCFRAPILLPSAHPLVEQLIQDEHLKSGHAGIQYLMSILREKVWILRARQTIRRVLRHCKRCLRFTTRSYSPDPATLPENRVKTVAAFQVVGIDLAGPLYLRNHAKAWIILFTCAVYRCVHLDFVLSLSTESFLESLLRFINIRGRPNVIYSDNGTNFTGASNAFQQINWEKVEEQSSVRRIKWIFNPPAAAWWGGWWERLIRSTKDLLKRMLGRARVDSEELRTCLSVVEATLNDRPLTTVTEDAEDLIPLTPAMFLRGIAAADFPEYHEVSSTQLQQDFHRKQTILKELQSRFRKEYLSQLVQRAKERVNIPSVGDLVLVGQENKKRLEWPLARVTEIIPGRDGKVRVARVKTMHGTLTRPIQKLYPMEISGPVEFAIPSEAKQAAVKKAKSKNNHNHETVSKKEQQRRTRSGRLVNQPDRLGYV